MVIVVCVVLTSVQTTLGVLLKLLYATCFYESVFVKQLLMAVLVIGAFRFLSYSGNNSLQ